MLFSLNWGLRMGSVSFIVLFLIALSVLLSFAEESQHPPFTEEEWKHHPRCPSFDCQKLGWLHFPFNNEANPECGLSTVVNCSEDTPQIQLERGGRYFGVKYISQADVIVIQDEQLQEHLKQDICESIHNLSSSRSSSISFKPVSSLTVLTLFKCLRNHSIHPITTEYNYTRCHDYIIHYNHPNHASIPPSPLPPPPNCSIIEYPVNMSLGITDLLPLLNSDITLEVRLFPDCWDCLQTKSQCQDDEKGKFQCANVIGAQHI